jgi:hypothetical protein
MSRNGGNYEPINDVSQFRNKRWQGENQTRFNQNRHTPGFPRKP